MAKGKNSFLRNRAEAAALFLCSLGALISAYLFVADFVLGGAELCLTGKGCDAVRESRYSSLGGVPVSLLGVLGYAAMATAAVSPLGRRARWNMLFWFSAAAVGFSAYLTYLELFVIEAVCSWCVASAAIATLVFTLAAFQKKTQGGASAARSVGGAAAVFVLIFAVSYSVHSPSRQESAQSSASFYQVSLARYLSDQGATMYGSRSCSHCERQKELFGSAFGYVTYVECSRGGPNPNPALCEAKNIKSYPTWEIGGELYEGVKTLEQLGSISGYSGEESPGSATRRRHHSQFFDKGLLSIIIVQASAL